MTNLCKCGCGEKVRLEFHKYIHGHNNRGKPNLKMRGRIPHNKGKTKYNYEPLKRVSEKSRKNSSSKKIEVRNKIKNTLKRKYANGELKSPMKDKHHTEKSTLKTSNSIKALWRDPNSIYNSKEYRNKLSKAFSLEKNPRWLDGKSFEEYDLNFNNKFKEIIRRKNNYRCRLCNIQQNKLFTKDWKKRIINYKLHIHHINYNKSDCRIINLISLCHPCHMKTNHNRNYWISFFTSLLKINNEVLLCKN